VSILAGTSTARADHAPALGIECPALGLDDLAALEARARAELGLSGRRGAAVSIDCDARRVLVSSEGRAPVERRVAAELQGVAFVDALVNTLHALLVEKPPGEAPPPIVRVVPAEPVSEDVVVVPERRRSMGVAIAGGVDSELWSGAIAAALGGHVGVRLAMNARWSAELDGGIVWRLGATPQGLEGRTIRGALQVDYAPIEPLRIGLAAETRILVASATGSTAPSTRDAVTVGAMAVARYAIRAGRVEILVGPQIEVFAWPVVVQADGSESFRLPSVLAGVSLEAAIDLGDARSR
jgi:hypothetical protein